MPYGKSLLGEIILADPIDACSPVKLLKNENKPFFLIVERGKC